MMTNKCNTLYINKRYFKSYASCGITVKALINARAFIRIVTFHREGVGVYKRLECSQSIFEENKSFCLFLSLQYHVKLLYEL